MPEDIPYNEIGFRMRDGTDYWIRGVTIKAPKNTPEEEDSFFAIARVFRNGNEIFDPRKRPRFTTVDDAIDAAFPKIKEYHYAK